jgi:hypothetical protein
MIQLQPKHRYIALLTGLCALAGVACDDVGPLAGGLNGAFGNTWRTRSAPANVSPLAGLQSFHYSGEPYLYDFTQNLRYDIGDDSWSEMDEEPPFGDGDRWVNGAVNATGIWIPRDDEMYRFKLSNEQWTTEWMDVQDGSERSTAAVMDGRGFVWYCTRNYLVQFNPSDGTAVKYRHRAEIDLDHTRLAYSPSSNRILFAGHGSNEFLRFHIDTFQLSESSQHPDGPIRDNSCQDRSGGIYVGNSDFTMMYRYDIEADTWTALPLLPAVHDDESSCVVSADGWLYYPTNSSGSTEFFRLRLGRDD